MTHSHSVPSILTQALPKIREGLALRLASKGHSVQPAKRQANRIPFRVGQSKRKLIARGSGVYEDQASGDIWYREGEFLVRKAIDTSSLVENYLKTCQTS